MRRLPRRRWYSEFRNPPIQLSIVKQGGKSCFLSTLVQITVCVVTGYPGKPESSPRWVPITPNLKNAINSFCPRIVHQHKQFDNNYSYQLRKFLETRYNIFTAIHSRLLCIVPAKRTKAMLRNSSPSCHELLLYCLQPITLYILNLITSTTRPTAATKCALSSVLKMTRLDTSLKLA